jgi:putative membrane protein
MLVCSLALLLGIYVAGLARVWSRGGVGRGIRLLQAVAFGAGWITLVAALSPPMDEWSDQSLAAHMVQHELLMIIAAPLIALGAPMIAVLWALPFAVRQRTLDLVRLPLLARTWTVVTSPASAFFIYAITLWVWHIPLLYDAALAHENVHVLQHVCFFSTATLFWWTLAHGRHGRAAYGAAVVYLFATAVHGGLLGALLTVSPRVWYLPYTTQHLSGFTTLEDQQVAGLLMWVPASIAFVAGGLTLFAQWLRLSDQLSRFSSDPSVGPTRVERWP